MTQVLTEDFPYEEIRTLRGDYFTSIYEAIEAGFAENQIWSVCETNSDEATCITIGPNYHLINLLGYIATKETHDNNTYYQEVMQWSD